MEKNLKKSNKSINATKRGSCFNLFHSIRVVTLKSKERKKTPYDDEDGPLIDSLDFNALGFIFLICKCLDTKWHILCLQNIVLSLNPVI